MRTGLNPFFLTATVDYLLERGFLAAPHGRWRLAEPLVGIVLCLRLQRGCGVRGWGRDGLGTGARGRGARARRALMSTSMKRLAVSTRDSGPQAVAGCAGPCAPPRGAPRGDRGQGGEVRPFERRP